MTDGPQDKIRAELIERVESLNGRFASLAAGSLAADLDSIRSLAVANGFGAMPPVIRAIESALGRGERGPHIANGIALLADAAHCGTDRAGASAVAALCSQRVAG